MTDTPTDSEKTETEPATDDEDQEQARLQELFVDVTGTDEVTAHQKTAERARDVEGEEAAELSGYVHTVVKDDGLDETLPEPDVEGG